jgi:hypothetical protein
VRRKLRAADEALLRQDDNAGGPAPSPLDPRQPAAVFVAALNYFTRFCNRNGLAAMSYLAFGTDPMEELTKLAEEIKRDFPESIFFTSKLIFDRDNWYIRQLHSEAAVTLLRRLHLRNMAMVILPMKL